MTDGTNFKIVGLYFGYPKCCIDWFIKRVEAIDAGVDWQNSLTENQKGFCNGFIPCPVCAETVKPGQEHTLIQNRYCEVPFQHHVASFPDEAMRKKILTENLKYLILG